MGFTLMIFLGLVSSMHCVSMCGPIIAIATAPVTDGMENWKEWKRVLFWQLNYHAGRGITYISLGAILASLNQLITSLFTGKALGGVIQVTLGLLMIIVTLVVLIRGKVSEAPDKDHWFSKVLRKFVTSGSKHGMFALGLATGLLPCGVLYAAFARSIAASNALEGAGLMLAFWLGTTPLLLSVGLFSGSFFKFIGRYSSALVVCAMVVVGSQLIYKGYCNLIPHLL